MSTLHACENGSKLRLGWLMRLPIGLRRTPKVFICYRREDSEAYAGRIRDKLVAAFDENSVFMDVDSILPGADFQQVLTETVGQSDVLLTVIGPRWLECCDDSGRSRIDNEEDYVRREIMTAVERKIAILPVLVGGARVPHFDRLPHEIRSLARRHAVQVSHSSWGTDTAKLLNAVRQLSKTSQHPREAALEDFQALESGALPEDRLLVRPERLAKQWKLVSALASLVLVAIIAGLSWRPGSAVRTASVTAPLEVTQSPSERGAIVRHDPATATYATPAPVDVSALRRLSANALTRGDFEGALQSMSEAMAVKPDDPDIHRDLEQLLSTVRGDLVRAFQQMPKAPADPLSAADYRNAMKKSADATTLAQAGRKIEAVQSLITAKQSLQHAVASARNVSQPNLPAKSPPATDLVAAQRAEIEAVLRRYVEAYERRDPAAIRRVWPSAPAALTRDLANARMYRLALVDVEIAIQSDTAQVSCIRQITVQAAAGREQSASPRTTIFLQRRPTGWLITNVRD